MELIVIGIDPIFVTFNSKSCIHLYVNKIYDSLGTDFANNTRVLTFKCASRVHI